MLVLSVFLTEGSINPFTDNIADFIIKSFGMEEKQVGLLICLLYVALIPFSLVLGKLIEVIPAQKRNLMILSKALYFGMLIWVSNLETTDRPTSFYYAVIIAFLLVMSFNWAVFHSIVEPITSYYVKEEHMGTAWGVIGSTLGFTQSVFSVCNIVITGSSLSQLKSYSSLIKMFVIVGGLSLLIAIWIRFRDYSILDKTYEERNEDEEDNHFKLQEDLTS